MTEPFCTVMISTAECVIKIDAYTERAAADATEAFLRRHRAPDQSTSVGIECVDSAAGKRIIGYLSDLADHLAHNIG